MKIYWILFFIIFFIHLFPLFHVKREKVKLIISFLLIFLYASLRANGFDYDIYEQTFYDVKKFYFSNYIFESRMEKGYLLLNFIMPSFRFFLIFLSAFTCFTYYYLFLKYIPSRYYWLGFVLLAISGHNMLIFQISGLRNAVAINILTLSIPLIVHRKIKTYIALTLLAYFFHNSAIFYMPIAYFLATPSKFKKKNLIIWTTLILFIMITSSTFLIGLSSTFIDQYFIKYSSYIEGASDKIYERSYLMYIFVSTTLVMIFSMLRRVNLTNTENVILKLVLFFLFSLLLGNLNFRMSQYFAPYLIISCFVFINKAKSLKLKYSYLAIISVFLLYSFFFVFMGNPIVSSFEYNSILE